MVIKFSNIPSKLQDALKIKGEEPIENAMENMVKLLIKNLGEESVKLFFNIEEDEKVI